MTNRQRYAAALSRVIKVNGDNSATLQAFNAAITAKHPRLDLIADQAEQYAADVEQSANICYLIDQGDNGVEPVAHNISPFPCVDEDAIPY